MLSADDIKVVWDQDASRRAARARRRAYFQGRERIQELLEKRIDGRQKSRAITNWTKYAAKLHAGFLASERPNYTLTDPMAGGDAGAEALRAWEEEYRDKSLALMDRRHVEQALLYGFSIEVQTWNPKGGTEYWIGDPLEWALVEDAMGVLRGAVSRVELSAGTLFGGLIQRKPVVLWHVYDETGRRVWREAPGGSGQGEMLMEEPLLRQELVEGRLPLTVFRVGPELESFFGDDFLVQSDVYNITRSALGDDIRHNVDSLLFIKGMALDKMLQKDEHGRTVLEKLKGLGVLPLPSDGDAGYLNRAVDVEKFKYDLKVTRQSLHLMACLPDLDDVIGGNDSTITNISGVALKLMFHSMLQAAAEFARWIELGLRDRIALWNARRARLGLPVLEGFEAALQPHIPMNEMEVIQYLPNLSEVLSHRDVLRLLPMVGNVEQAHADWLSERGETNPGGQPAATPGADPTMTGANDG
jgi:hypothetical protein